MLFFRYISFVLLVLLLAACDKNNIAIPNAAVSTNPPAGYLDHAQPKLPTLRLWVGAREMEAELALNHTQMATGMMYRKEMGTNDGMLFVFGRPVQASFYMRNTFVPLSSAYIDPE